MVRNVISQHEGEIVEVRGRVSVRYPRHESGKIAVAPVDVIVDGVKVGSEHHINIFPGDYRNIPVPQVHWDVVRGDVIVVRGRVESYRKRGGVVDYCIRDPSIEVVSGRQPQQVRPVRRVRRSKPSYDDIPEGC
jgi:hypothetical protein